MTAAKKESGYLEVADFVEVVNYNPEVYPNGVRKYKVARDGEAPEVAEQKQA